MLGIPQNIFSLAAPCPSWCTIEMVDESIGCKLEDDDYDMYVLMFGTPDAIRAYDLADDLRQRGKLVVLGGLHVSFMTEEALCHGDVVMIGETEGIFEEVLNDYCDDKLKKTYKRSKPVDLSDLKPFPTDIIPASAYEDSWTVLVSRGCVNKCSYCTVHEFFKSYRKRPIEAIVEEIKNCDTDFIELKADNFFNDRAYALDLFKAIEDLDIIWFTSMEPSFADDEELVIAAAKSGLRSVLLGIETPSKVSLAENNKSHLDHERLKKQIAFLHAHDIEVDAAMLFGFDDHTEDIWEETLNFVLDIGIDVTHAVAPIPFPGTKLYDKLDKSDRLITKDWSKYDGAQLVYEHPTLSADNVSYGLYWYEEAFNKHHVKRHFDWHHRWS